MVRQKGPPSIFCTFSPSEINWDELLNILIIHEGGNAVSISELEKWETIEKIDLVNRNPVITVMYFNHRFNSFFITLSKRQMALFKVSRSKIFIGGLNFNNAVVLMFTC